MYILYLYPIFVCHILFYCIFRHYMSQRQTTVQFENGNNALLLLLFHLRASMFVVYYDGHVHLVLTDEQKRHTATSSR